VPALWQTSGAEQETGDPVQLPFWHESPVVHALPSSQPAPFDLTGFEQMPVLELHVPAVWHWSLAVQLTGVPEHVPAAH
jgi:hypothetical protein